MVLATLVVWTVYHHLPKLPTEQVVDPVLEKGEEIDRTGRVEETPASLSPVTRDSARELEVDSLPGTRESSLRQGAAPGISDPPQGYSFVTTQGEMLRARMEPVGLEPDSEAEPDPDRSWLEAPASIGRLAEQAGAMGRDWTFGWVRVNRTADLSELSDSLRRLGVQVLGGSGDLMRARLPGSEALLQAVADLPGVSGLGPTPRRLKLDPEWGDQVRSSAPGERTPVFITLMPGDPDGRWRGELEDLGAVVAEYDPDIRVYAADVDSGVLEDLAAADFVLAIEGVSSVEPAHDTSVPAMGADALRVYDHSTGLFTGIGGASVAIGVMDTGLNLNHPDISSGRESICGGSFAIRDPATSDQDLWIDEHGHGTHVTGTIVGSGHLDPRLAGMAPLVRHIRFAKVLHHLGIGDGAGVGRGMDYLAEASSCGESGGTSVAVKPLVVNMSLAATSTEFQGRSTDERKLDAIVWTHRQMYVVAQANLGAHGFSNYAAAKNSLAVGAVQDNGELAYFSSHGPTKDGRLAPQVTGTGVALRSPRGEGNRGGYVTLSGTSMAAPSVAGVAALLMDASPDFREQPALVRARLMASAIKPDGYLEDPGQYAPNNTNGPAPLQNRYGLGKVSARASVLNRDQADGWVNGSAVTELVEGEYAYQDIEVPEGASRLDVVMTWDETPADTIASSVLNDLDLWVDRDADCETAICGEYASQSRIDNVEWVLVKDPAPGTYRIKTIVHRGYGTPPRAAVAWTVIRGRTKPALEVTVDRPVENLRPGQTYEVDLTVRADAYIADGVTLRIDCRGKTGYRSACSEERMLAVRASTASREDALSRSLRDDFAYKPLDPRRTMALGEIAVGEIQRLKLVFRRAPADEAFRLHFTASGWNAIADSASVEIRAGSGAAPPESERPRNDDFEQAMELAGSEGESEFDLLVATPDPSEPPLDDVLQQFFTFKTHRRPERSIWYTWKASETGLIGFSIREEGTSGPTDDGSKMISQAQLDAFEGDRIVSLAPVASKLGGSLIFPAESGTIYRIRLSSFVGALGSYQPSTYSRYLHLSVVPLVLRWSQEIRPSNDDFRFGTLLDGETGSIAGDNEGATLEPGELFGNLMASVWYRWTAPSDGYWAFQLSHSNLSVLVFAGDNVSELRFLSGYPGDHAVFRVRGGEDYRIAVASKDTEFFGGRFDLHWWRLEHEPEFGNDYFEKATPLGSMGSTSGSVQILSGSTVEPEEPLETGSRTAWWTWTAPRDGEYTWRPRLREVENCEVEERRAWLCWLQRQDPPIKLTAFRGDAIDDLSLVASSLPETRSVPEMKFSAREGDRFRIVVGMIGETSFVEPGVVATLDWGLAPVNDDLESATRIADANGTIVGSNRFATLDPAARAGVGIYAYGSVWWSWVAPAKGWYRFWLEESSGILEIYDGTGNDFASLQLVTANDVAEAIFQADADAAYTIRFRSDRGEEFTLRWNEHAPPAWLRYDSRYVDGGVDSTGTAIELWDTGKMAFNTDGTELYVVSGTGLLVFERDPGTGRLNWAQTLVDVPGISRRSALFWDSHRSSLYLSARCAWHAYDALGGSAGLEYAGRRSIGGCVGGSAAYLLMDSTGSFPYVVDPHFGQIGIFAAHASGTDFQQVEAVGIEQLKHALISNSNTHLYAATETSLLVFERDLETGALSLARTLMDGDQSGQGMEIDGLSTLQQIAIIGEDEYLLAFGGLPPRITVFDLYTDLSSPTYMGTFRPSVDVPWHLDPEAITCPNAFPRNEKLALDLFCRYPGPVGGWILSLQWSADTQRLLVSDSLAALTADRFGNDVPALDAVNVVTASPDGRHLYLGSPLYTRWQFERDEQQIMIVERIDNEPDEVDSGK